MSIENLDKLYDRDLDQNLPVEFTPVSSGDSPEEILEKMQKKLQPDLQKIQDLVSDPKKLSKILETTEGTDTINSLKKAIEDTLDLEPENEVPVVTAGLTRSTWVPSIHNNMRSESPDSNVIIVHHSNELNRRMDSNYVHRNVTDAIETNDGWEMLELNGNDINNDRPGNIYILVRKDDDSSKKSNE